MSMSDISFEHVLSSQYTVFDGLAGMHVEDIVVGDQLAEVYSMRGYADFWAGISRENFD